MEISLRMASASPVTSAIERDLSEIDGTIRSWSRNDGDHYIESGSVEWLVSERFSTGYQLETSDSVFPMTTAERHPVGDILFDGDDATAAVATLWTARADSLDHNLALTYRLFRDWPFVEMVLSATRDAASPGYRFSGADWNGRTVYLKDRFDRMVSDTQGDEPLDKASDTSMHWLVVYDSATHRGFGWFLPGQGMIRATGTDGKVSIYDSCAYSAAGTAVFRNLWMASEAKDAIISLFDAMAPGANVSPPEDRDLNIVTPVTGDHLFPGDTLSLAVTSPGNAAAVSATLIAPDGSSRPLSLKRGDDPLTWRPASPWALTPVDPAGTWALRVETEQRVEVVTIEVRHPQHPHLLFSATELPGIRARKDDPAYQEIWAGMLERASDYGDPDPSPGVDLDIRGYADRLIDLALIQLVDPDQPYDDLLWKYFFAMLRYPNWDPEATPFYGDDLTVGHFLTALALTYDWHYERLTAAERSEARDLLGRVARERMASSWMRTYRDLDWTHYGTVTNNHYWINHEGVAAATFVLADEIPEEERLSWIDRLEENLAIGLSTLEDDGTSNEGIAYAAYGQINLFRWLDMRDRALSGNTAEAVPWFVESVLWNLYSIVPGGDDNYGGVANFGDCDTRHYDPPRTINAWLASRLGDGYAQWVANQLDWLPTTAMSYLWYDPSIQAISPTTLPIWRLFPHKGIFTWRSSWENDAAYLSIKSGSYFGGHEQPDAGQFILYREGVPYITDHGYSYLKMTDEHNVILVDGTGQQGEGNPWMPPVDPTHWASVVSALGDERYFDVVVDPTPMYLSEALAGWSREVVGLGPDLFFIRDDISAKATVTIDWLLHSHISSPPDNEGRTYTYQERRTENPWTNLGARLWSLRPQEEAPVMYVSDLSYAAWDATVEPSYFVPAKDPDTGRYNESRDSFQIGYRLERRITTDQARSLTALWFGEDLVVQPWSSTSADGARVRDSIGDVAHIFWPTANGIFNFHGYYVTGKMGGRRFDDPAYFGRSITYLSHAGELLVTASRPVDIFAYLEGGGGEVRFAIVHARADTDLTLYCPQPVTQVWVDGIATHRFTWTGSTLSLTLPPGEHRLDLQ